MTDHRTRPCATECYWRWGIPLAAMAGALTAACLAAALLWDMGASSQLWTADRLGKTAIGATAFATALLVFWRIGRAAVVPTKCERGHLRAGAVLGVAVVLASVVLAARNLNAPLRGDESMSIVGYATQTFAAAAGKYTSPSNHVLHTVLVWVAHQFGGWNRVVLRMPAFLSFCLLLPVLWWFVRREHGYTAAGFAIVFVGASPFFVSYATDARGYTLLLLFFATALLCGQTLVRAPNSRRLWATWTTVVALGFYTMPLMAFPAVATVIWMLAARWRRYGRDGIALFAGKTAVCSAAALAIAGALYAPVLATEGVDGFLSGLAKGAVQWPPPDTYVGTPVRRALLRPLFLWNYWHTATPAWLPGVLLALVAVGLGVRGRTCGRRGTLGAALVASTVVVWAARPFDVQPRMAIWALLVLMIAAGAGAAFVLEQLLTLTRTRWPKLATSRFDVARSGVAVVALGAIVWLGGSPKVVSEYGGGDVLTRSLPAMTSAMRGQMRSGDYLTISDRLALPTIAYVKAQHEVDDDAAAWFVPLPNGAARWPAHRLLAPRRKRAFADPTTSASESAAAGSHGAYRSEPSPARLFLFDASSHSPRYGADGVRAQDFLEAHWPNHEVAAAAEGGRVYVLSAWSEGS